MNENESPSRDASQGNASEKERVPEPVELMDASGRVLLKFTWTGDRFAHSIVAGSDRLECVAGGGEDAWPDSPPLQQLSLETIDDSDVVLGVGCAGTSHWSISVEPLQFGFRFDLACKSKAPPSFLGTTYTDPSGFEITAGSDAKTEPGDSIHQIVPSEPLAEPKTYRWSYVIQATSL